MIATRSIPLKTTKGQQTPLDEAIVNLFPVPT